MDNNQNIDKVELQQDERILLFLQGKMTADEEKLLIEDLQKDTDFKARAINMARLAKGINQVGEEKDQILKEALLSVDESAVRNIAHQTTKQAIESESAIYTLNQNKQTKMVLLNKKVASILQLS